jgi:predicted regulator of Ras-like GTPase activity (Roadblock/LC7/MglB family)
MSRASHWSFTQDDADQITRILMNFLQETNSRSALLVDRAGQLVTTVGEQPQFDATAFATLAAADFSANDQLARLIGETDFTTLFHQGERDSMYVADVARRLILVVLFDQRTTLGLVRLRLKAAVNELNSVFSRPQEAQSAEHGAAHLLAGAEDDIDRLFS